MKKLFNVECVIFGMVLLYTSHFTPSILYAQSVSSSELINNAKIYDGKMVVYEGEVIGDVMIRGDFAWINVNDGDSAIGIWLKKDLVKEIVYKGGYSFKGDWVRVKGSFNRSCLEHGGDIDIHAVSLEKIESGRKIPEKLNPAKLNLSIKLGGILLCLIILNLCKRRQKKR